MDEIDIKDVLKRMGIDENDIILAAMELYFPHSGVKTREKTEAKFRAEMDLALSDPNLALLIYARRSIGRRREKMQSAAKH